MSAAITRSRSPAESSARRSTSRYCSDLASGTGLLREELVDRREGLRVVPLALAEHLVAHAPARIDDEGHRQPADLPAPRGLLVAVHHHRQLHELALEEGADALGLLAEIDRDHLEGLARARPLQALERRQLVAARLAPRRPEVHHHDFPAAALQVEGLALHVRARELRCALALPGLQVRLGKSRGGHDGEGRRGHAPRRLHPPTRSLWTRWRT